MKPRAPLLKRVLCSFGISRDAGIVSLRTIKRAVILVAGCTVLALGVALIVLPGPAIIVIPAGLAILAIEFAWARRWLQRMRELVRRTRGGEIPDTDGPAPGPSTAAGRTGEGPPAGKGVPSRES
jgi:hypothetical protein